MTNYRSVPKSTRLNSINTTAKWYTLEGIIKYTEATWRIPYYVALWQKKNQGIIVDQKLNGAVSKQGQYHPRFY